MKLGQASFLTLQTAFLMLLLVAPAGAAPALALGSTSGYDLTATLETWENCTSENATIAVVVCGSETPFSTYAFVSIVDNGQCEYGDASCAFSPSNVTIIPGGRIEWFNQGRQNHTVTSDSPVFDFFMPNGTFVSNTFTFSSEGVFEYYCSIHPWMTGKVNVILPPPLPPKTQSFSLDGSIGWTVVGLDDDALLSILHDVSVYDTGVDPPRLVFTRSGIVEQTIELATRIESGGMGNPLQTFPYLLGLPSFGYGITNVNLITYPPYPFPFQESHTIWWVNGPLRLGSTLEILTGYASVRGESSVDLGPDLGTWDAWIVGSQFVDKYSQSEPPLPQPGPIFLDPFGPRTIIYPYPQYYVANSTNAVSLEFNYGKQSDLLLRASAAVDSYLETVTVYPAASYVYGPFGSLRISEKVEVTRARESSLSVNLDLVSTSLDLNSRMALPASEEIGTTGGGTNTPPDGTNTPNNFQAAVLPLAYGAIGAAVAVLISGGVWVAKRSQRKISAETQSFPAQP